MVVLVTCKNEVDPLKNSDTQGQLILESVVRSGRISNSSELFPCKYKKDLIKKEQRKSADTMFPIISLWGIFLTLMSS